MIDDNARQLLRRLQTAPGQDPLSSNAFEHVKTASAASATASWARHDFSIEPFSSNSHLWASQQESTSSNLLSGNGREHHFEPPSSAHDHEHVQQDEEEEESFTYPSEEPTLRNGTSIINSQIQQTSTGTQPPAPITMRASSSSLSRERSPSTSAINEGRSATSPPLSPIPTTTTSASSSIHAYGVSLTPRGVDSPFSSRANAENNILSLQHSPTTSSSADHILSSTPSASNNFHSHASSLRTAYNPPVNNIAHTLSTARVITQDGHVDKDLLKKLVFSAASSGDLDRLHSLVDASNSEENEDYPSPFSISNWRNGEGETPLHQAAYRGHLAVMIFLENAGANVEVQDNDGWTPLHNAASKGYLDIVKWLIEDAGAAVDTRSKHGYSALMNAASRGHLPIVLFLTTKHKADPLLRNEWGETASDLAAAVFEATICSVLASHEISSWSATHPPSPNLESATAASSSDSNKSPKLQLYNPLALHSTVPIVLHENQRLARPTLKKLSTLGNLAVGQAPRWSSKALSRNDRRSAFTMPPLPGMKTSSGLMEEGEANLPVFRSEVGLPVVGKEDTLILPPLREVRSGGKVGAPLQGGTVRGPRSTISEGKRPALLTGTGTPTARRASIGTSSAASSALAAALASSSSGSSNPKNSPPVPSNSSFTAPDGEAAWFWLSDWLVDLTDRSSSPVDGWSYAPSFDTPDEDWSSEPPPELQKVLEEGAGVMGLGGQKWVRRRRWLRVMKRRLDVPAWGGLLYGAEHQNGLGGDFEGSSAESSKGPDVPDSPSPNADYLVRAQFLAGAHHFTTSNLNSASDRSSIRSGKTALGNIDRELDKAELRKAAARLERATDELRTGTVSDENAERRRKAEDQLEAFLHQLALIKAELGSGERNEDEDEDDDDDDEFIYTGRDADPDDDARSTWTANERPPSIRSARSASGAHAPSSPDYFLSQPTPSATATPTSPFSPYQDLTPQLSRAPEFRVPTHETSRIRNEVVKPRNTTRTSPIWEADEAAHDCRRCHKKFTFFIRKHHCRRCGLVVCASCSSNADRLDPSEVVQAPGGHDEDFWSQPAPYKFRTCDTCHAALTMPQGVGTGASTSVLSAIFPSPSSPSAGGSVTPSETGASDVSELQDCPVCGQVLANLGGRTEQEAHVKDCLETGGGAIASNGSYLVFKLPPGPLVSEECKICFVEFEVGDKLARLPCLCYFHQTCIRAWLDRGRSCPFHASK
ncbi:hypothetical protein T439DRAFT_351802 [Meredithblackwellia eburnea MCA 4105]